MNKSEKTKVDGNDTDDKTRGQEHQKFITAILNSRRKRKDSLASRHIEDTKKTPLNFYK